MSKSIPTNDNFSFESKVEDFNVTECNSNSCEKLIFYFMNAEEQIYNSQECDNAESEI